MWKFNYKDYHDHFLNCEDCAYRDYEDREKFEYNLGSVTIEKKEYIIYSNIQDIDDDGKYIFMPRNHYGDLIFVNSLSSFKEYSGFKLVPFSKTFRAIGKPREHYEWMRENLKKFGEDKWKRIRDREKLYDEMREYIRDPDTVFVKSGTYETPCLLLYFDDESNNAYKCEPIHTIGEESFARDIIEHREAYLKGKNNLKAHEIAKQYCYECNKYKGACLGHSILEEEDLQAQNLQKTIDILKKEAGKRDRLVQQLEEKYYKMCKEITDLKERFKRVQ